MKKSTIFLAVAALFAAVMAASADVMIDDGVKSVGYVGKYYEADIYIRKIHLHCIRN